MAVSSDQVEWLEADGRGGFASGTSSGIRTRRYHALWLPATRPPTGRMLLVSGADVWLDHPLGTVALTSQRYAPDVIYPDGVARLAAFASAPWPTWTYHVEPGVEVRHELFVDRGSGATILSWHSSGLGESVPLRVRLFLAARDYHSMQHENGAFRFEPVTSGQAVTFQPYDGVPAIACLASGTYRHAPDWYRQFLYAAERDRGLDATEDLGSPGEFSLTLSDTRPAVLILGAADALEKWASLPPVDVYERCRISEGTRRRTMADPLQTRADSYLVQRGGGRTIVAG